MNAKSLLYVLQQPPYLDDRVFEAFDALLVAAAFEQRVSLLFRGAGVTQLLAHQDPANQRNLAKILLSLDAYEVNQIYVDAQALAKHGVTLENCVIKPTLVSGDEISTLINSQDAVLTD